MHKKLWGVFAGYKNFGKKISINLRDILLFFLLSFVLQMHNYLKGLPSFFLWYHWCNWNYNNRAFVEADSDSPPIGNNFFKMKITFIKNIVLKSLACCYIGCCLLHVLGISRIGFFKIYSSCRLHFFVRNIFRTILEGCFSNLV